MRSLVWATSVAVIFLHQALLPLGLGADAVLVAAATLLYFDNYGRAAALVLISGALLADITVLAPRPIATLAAISFILIWLPLVSTRVHDALSRLLALLLGMTVWFALRLGWHSLANRQIDPGFALAWQPLDGGLAIGCVVIAWLLFEGLAKNKRRHGGQSIYAAST